MNALHRCLASLLLTALVFLAGCASPTRPSATAETNFWQGRLSLQIATAQPQSFSAGFELSGQSQAGTLLLNSPLGNTVAELTWTPQNATLKTGGELRSFETLDDLLRHSTGTTIPVQA
ncbi:MAG: lipoprotein insertase outer membrane protein LolB, partial [Burkholderiaceae bacterium]